MVKQLIIIQKQMKLIIILIGIFLCISSVSSAVTSPIEAMGTTLPQLSSSSPYRVFNDLMKQSLPLVPYNTYYGTTIGRYWGYTLNYINGLSHQYPASLPSNVFAVAQIPFFEGIDNSFLNQNFTLKFSGSGTVGVTQTGLYNLTWGSGAGGNFTLKSLRQSLFVYIYNTKVSDPVNSITILPSNMASNPATFTDNFLYYLKPFNLLRTCFWQGQNYANSGLTKQIWANRTLKSSSTQVSSVGVALEYIIELETAANVTLWPCIPDTADSDYVQQFATLLASSRNQSKIMYLQYGNVYTIMNNFPDAVITPIFDNFIQTYGRTYRSSILFTINYKDIQYYINAVGMRTSPPINFTYIDAYGADATFGGNVDATNYYGLNDTALKTYITHLMLAYELTLNKAYQLAKKNGSDLVLFSGGPNLKTMQFGWIWKNKTNTNDTIKTLAAQELNVSNVLNDLNLKDPWVGQLYLQWKARLTSIGIKTVMYNLLVGAYTLNRDYVTLLPFLNMTTPAYLALNASRFLNKKTILPTVGVVPSNPFTCSPVCKWGDCVKNVCACYAGYSGSDCSVYTAPNVQNKVGVNIQGLSYWNSQHPFVDLHRQGSAWVYFIHNQGWSSGDAYKSQVPLDSNGYPTYLPPGITVGTLMSRDVVTHYDKGTYVILYDGDGILSFGMYDVVAVRYGIGRVEVDVVPSTNMNNGLLVMIDRTNPDNYIRNIRVIRPGFQQIWQAVNFSPLMLDKLQPYGTLRFMDWANTNAQIDAEWANRVKTTERAYTRNGVAWQQMIRLCNTLGKNAWINVPHLASDDYIKQLAQLFFDNLEPHLNVYVEYSNQVWGTLFPGGQYAQAQGIVRNYAPNDPTQARFCFLGQRTNDISTIFKSVFGALNSRLKIIISTQAVNADTTRRILICKGSQNFVDGVAIAPYLSVPITDNMTFPLIFTALRNQIPTLSTLLKTHLVYTKQYNLSLYCYQSGQGLEGSNTVTNNLQIGVQTADDMLGIYTTYHEMLFNNSIALTNQFTDSGLYSRYGSWGLFQFTDERPQASKKWLGLKAYFLQQSLQTGVQQYGACTKDCNGNGICSFGKCFCYSDYTGQSCEIGKFIDFINCGYLCTFNQGTCGLRNIEGINRYYNCTCLPGYMGNECGIPICSSQCSYSGKCTAPEVCTCFRGRMGASCQTDCGCNGHGTCNSDGTCLCDTGFIFNTVSKKCQYDCFGKASSQCYGPNLLKPASGCVSGTPNNGTCVCWPGYSGADCSVQVAVTYPNNNLGVNVGGLAYWSTQHLFKDHFKQSSEWIPQYYPGLFNSTIAYTWNTSQYFPKQINGYPSSLAANQTVAKLCLRDLSLKYPSINTTNQYVLLYDGDGILNLGFDAAATETSAGRIKFTVTPTTVRDNGVIVRLYLTNPANPVRNIRVLLAEDQYIYEKDLITATFMKFISQFSTIRYMDLLRTNGNPISEWAQTTRPDQDTQALPSGLAIQLIARLTNRTGRNVWFNVPHQATDDYVTKLANYLKANISSNRIIYVEYSNQVWNTFFAQGQYATAQATALGLANYHKFYAQRSLQIFNIFKTVFGANSPQLKFVISYQAVSKWVADQILTGTGLQGVVHVIAGAPYYDCDNIGNNTNTAYYATQTPSDIITKCLNSFDSITPYLSIENQVSLAYNNLSMAAYEAGTSISQAATIYNGGANPAATVNFIAANRDPGMYDVYKQLLYKYKQNNYTKTAPLMLFSGVGLPSKYGSWGLLDYIDQVNETPTHPKFQAILDFNQGL